MLSSPYIYVHRCIYFFIRDLGYDRPGLGFVRVRTTEKRPSSSPQQRWRSWVTSDILIKHVDYSRKCVTNERTDENCIPKISEKERKKGNPYRSVLCGRVDYPEEVLLEKKIIISQPTRCPRTCVRMGITGGQLQLLLLSRRLLGFRNMSPSLYRIRVFRVGQGAPIEDLARSIGAVVFEGILRYIVSNKP